MTRIIDAADTRRLEQLLGHDDTRDRAVERVAARIVADVRRRGDRAVVAWEKRIGGRDLQVATSDPAPVDTGTRDRFLRLAARHIQRVAVRQVPRPFVVTVCPGVRIEQRVQPFDRVGCYVPGGRYPLLSTLLMTAIPAKVAGVREVIVCCPRPTPAVMAAARVAGVDRVIAIGGAQAIAAMAYGTESIPRVDKIVGPGSAWVAAAKEVVAADCAIDMRAGPSEIVVYSSHGRAPWIAADLIAQAEHDPAARAILVTTSPSLARTVQRELRRQLPKQGPARLAIARRGGIVIVPDRLTAIAIVNRLAPEHLVCDAGEDTAAFRTAGTIFVGDWSAQAAGDYCTGSNHVLPTGGAARTRGGLSPADFVRVFTVQTITRRGLRTIGPAAIALAEAEGLHAHAASIRQRLGA